MEGRDKDREIMGREERREKGRRGKGRKGEQWLSLQRAERETERRLEKKKIRTLLSRWKFRSHRKKIKMTQSSVHVLCHLSKDLTKEKQEVSAGLGCLGNM